MRQQLCFLSIILFTLISCAPNKQLTDQQLIQNSMPSQQACPKDIKFCPDGSMISRVAPDCNFEACPKDDSGFCDYGSPKRTYFGKNKDECQRNPPSCKSYEKQFSDRCGCGCELPDWANGGSFCQDSERYYTECTPSGNTVCGIYFQGKGNCKEQWCKQNFANRCEACKIKEIMYAAAGECKP